MNRNLARELEALGADETQRIWFGILLKYHGYEMAEKYVNSLQVTLNREKEMDRCVV